MMPLLSVTPLIQGEPRFERVTRIRDVVGLKGHDEHVEDGIACKHGYLDVEDGAPVHRTSEQTGDLPLLGLEDTPGRLGVGGFGQRSPNWAIVLVNCW